VISTCKSKFGQIRTIYEIRIPRNCRPSELSEKKEPPCPGCLWFLFRALVFAWQVSGRCSFLYSAPHDFFLGFLVIRYRQVVNLCSLAHPFPQRPHRKLQHHLSPFVRCASFAAMASLSSVSTAFVCCCCEETVPGPATGSCSTCMALIEGCADPSICPSCVDLHGKKQKFKGHTLLAAGVKDYGADALAKFGKAPNGVFCTIHPSQMRIMQCISPCGGKLLCPLCFAGHELHKLGRLPELAVAAKQLISNVLAATSYGPGAPVIVASDLSFSSSELSSPKTFDSAGVDASSVLQPAEVQKSAATGPPPFIAAARATCQSLLSHMEALPASESTALKFVGEMEASLLEAVQKRCAELRAEIAKVAALKKVWQGAAYAQIFVITRFFCDFAAP
jgi:hypothetical protein